MLHVIAWNENNNNNDDDMSIFIVIIVIICRFSAPCQIQLTMRRIRSWLIFFLFRSFIRLRTKMAVKLNEMRREISEEMEKKNVLIKNK